MQKILLFQTEPLVSKPSVCLFNPIVTNISLPDDIFAPKSPIYSVSHPLSHQTQTKKSNVCARKRKSQNGSLRLQRVLLQLMPVIASNIKILPPPLDLVDLVIEEISGGYGDGGGFGIWKGFGGGGFDGFRSKKKRKLLLLFLFSGILVICGLGLLFGREVESNVLCWGLGFGLSGIALVQWWEKRGIVGVFLWGVLLGLGIKREELQKWGLRLRACYPIMETVTWRTPRRRRGRRAF